jgi:hypothetical protein
MARARRQPTRKRVLVAFIALLPFLHVGSSHALGGLGPDVTITSIHTVPGTKITLVSRSILGAKGLAAGAAGLPNSILRSATCPGPCPAGASAACCDDPNCNDGCWSQGFGIQWRYYTDGSGIQYYHATSSHYQGTAPYEHDAHGTLIQGWDHGGDQVWNDFNNPCDNVSLVDSPEIATCSSPFFNTHHGGQWFLVGGFHYDHYDDGTIDFPCDGCIDTKVTVP